MTKSRVFISSVQKELENERIAAQEILWTDPFLKNHCDPVLYEFEPALGSQDGYFEVTFYGPGDDLERLRVPANATSAVIEPAVESQLNDRQKQMVALLAHGEKLTSRVCEDRFGVSKVTLASDFKLLIALKIAVKHGSGRSTGYIWRAD